MTRVPLLASIILALPLAARAQSAVPQASRDTIKKHVERLLDQVQQR